MSMANSKLSADEMLAEDMGRFFADPLGFVMYAYDWGGDASLQVCELREPYASRYDSKYGPDLWACEFLDDLGRKVRANDFNGKDAVDAIREAIASGHGIGKSAIAAWLVDWIMSTRPHAQGTVTANTNTQLETKTWAQIAKWTKKSITGHWFNVTTGRGSMKMVHKDFPESWFCSAQTCREENSESFAGQHAPNSTSFYINDEGSAIPDKIYEVEEGGLTDGEPMQFVFGNPTRNSGKFHRIFHAAEGKRWNKRSIDSRTAQITNKALIQEWIDDYGVDSDFVKVRVRGMFPSMSIKQFISSSDVDKGFGKSLRPESYMFAPKILTCDPAWEGDDELVIALRQGLHFEILRTFPKNDNDIHVATILANLEDEHNADAVFIDGGYGTGIVSAGRTLKRTWQLVWFAEASPDPGYVNMRAYMWGQMRNWLKAGGVTPDDHVLYNDMIGPETVPRLDGKVQLESKKDMKKRGIASPNRADSLALSFAYPVSKKHGTRAHSRTSRGEEWDPLS